jgi:hypothetical protein
MTKAELQLASLRQICPGAKLLTEGGKPVVVLPDLQFQAAGTAAKMTLLLVPFEHSNYKTRLFFEKQIEGRGQNWNQHRVVDQQWWAPSWQGVSADLPWTEMLLAHLRCVA